MGTGTPRQSGERWPLCRHGAHGSSRSLESGGEEIQILLMSVGFLDPHPLPPGHQPQTAAFGVTQASPPLPRATGQQGLVSFVSGIHAVSTASPSGSRPPALQESPKLHSHPQP